jgi:hypothetical protein
MEHLAFESSACSRHSFQVVGGYLEPVRVEEADEAAHDPEGQAMAAGERHLLEVSIF